MKAYRPALCALSLLFSSACDRPASKEPSPPTPAQGSPRTERSAPESPKVKSPPAGTAADVTEAPSCGPLDCRLYASVELSLVSALAPDVQVVSFGEAHAQQGTEHIPSTAQRFTETILPVFAGRSSDLVLELMIPNPECRETETKVVEKQEEVTRPQAQSDQNEYLALAQRAKDLGIRPHVLQPSCSQYERILAAGADDISVMLEMTAELTQQKVKALLGLSAMRGTKGLILTYGGLMHNDLVPREGRERWTFGPALRDATGGRYLAVDLIVREYVKDTSVWQALPWFPHFDSSQHPNRAVAFRPARGELTVIYPLTPPNARAPGSAGTVPAAKTAPLPGTG